MAVTYGFYNSLNKDRMYNAEQMSSIFNGVITDGIFSTIGNALTTVAGTGLQVIVKPGKAWFNGTWTLNDALLPLDIETADVSLGRIDAVILEVDSSASVRANSIKVLKGTASANPVKPTLTSTENVHQYALAYVTVVAGTTSITAGNIEINVGKSSCPFVTSVLQQTNIDQLFSQWEAEFDAWFSNVQSQLSGDVATNLQRQIDDCIKIADKATNDDVDNGTAGKWIDAQHVDSLFRVGDIRESMRASIGQKWLLCDGSAFDRNAYQDLIAFNSIGKNKLDADTKRTDLNFIYKAAVSTSNKRMYMKTIGDYQVAFSWDYVLYYGVGVNYDSDTHKECVYVTKDLGEWVNLGLGIRSISYIDGRYLFCMMDSSNILQFGWTDDPREKPTSFVTSTFDGRTSLFDMVTPIVKVGAYYAVYSNYKESSTKGGAGLLVSTDLITWTSSNRYRSSTSVRPFFWLFSMSQKLVAITNNRGGLFAIETFDDLTNLSTDTTNMCSIPSIGGDFSPYGRMSIIQVTDGLYIAMYRKKWTNNVTYPEVGKLFKYTLATNNIVEIGDFIPACLAKKDSNGVYVLSIDNKIYNVTGTSAELVGALQTSATPFTMNSEVTNVDSDLRPITPMCMNFYIDNLVMAFVEYKSSAQQNTYLIGSFRNLTPKIDDRTTNVFIKGKD